MVDKMIADRFENVIAKGRLLLSQHVKSRERFTWLEGEPFAEWRDQSLALLNVVFGPDHPYSRNFERETTLERSGVHASPNHAQAGQGTLVAAAEDHANGYTWTLRERVHADVFDDYLEMAVHLLDGGYTTAAAVIAGTTLEEHLRKLCEKHGVTIHSKASVTNDNLLKQAVYSQAEWRLNQGWLDIRNDCAHNLSTNYDKKQIRQMIDGIREFMARHPA